MISMKKKQLFITLSVIALLALAVIYQANQSTTVDAFQVARTGIRQYVDDTGVVKARQSRTVYLENSGRITSLAVKEGDRIKVGAILVRLSPIDLELSAIAAKQARIDYEAACKDWEKFDNLYKAGAVSKKDFENAEDAYKRALASLNSANLELEKQRKSLVVRSSLNGVILQKSVDLDQVVTPGTEAFVIGDPRDLEVEVDILADEVVKVRPGNPVDISGQATGGSVLKGVVTKVAPMAKNIVSSLGVNQKRATVTIAFDGATGMLKPGYDVDVRIFTQTKPGAVVLPLSAVFDIRGKDHVFVITGERTQLRPIEKGIENDERVEVRSGLKAGEWVLEKPDNDVREGMRVKFSHKSKN
jgi:HlyD family secretion protein